MGWDAGNRVRYVNWKVKREDKLNLMIVGEGLI